MAQKKPFHSYLRSILRHSPLTLKMLLVTGVIGVSVWLFLDIAQSYSLEKMFRAKLAEELNRQSVVHRLRFDHYVKLHYKVAVLFAGQKKLADYLNKQNWNGSDTPKVKTYRRTPPWFPRLSVVRGFTQPRMVLLLDRQGRLREMYKPRRVDSLPEEILSNPLYRQLSVRQSYLTNVDGRPYLLATVPITVSSKFSGAMLMIVSPIDEAFLTASQRPGMNDQFIALVSGDSKRILVSSQSEYLPSGKTLDEISHDYLVTGEAFFDYGASDLVITLVSLISKGKIAALTGDVLATSRQYRAVTALGLIVSFALIMLWVTRRIGHLNQRIKEFSDHMGLKHFSSGRGDELQILEDRFLRLSEQIVAETVALEQQALHDALTGLPNRILLRDRLEQAIKNQSRDENKIALLMMDLDRFKDINDTLGHHVGDVMLQKVSERLLGILRASDTVARLGGDEFAVLLPLSDESDATQVAVKICHAISQPFVIENQNLSVGISIGIVLFPRHGKDPNALLQKADVAMYTAKNMKQGYAIYDPAKDDFSAERLSLLNDLRSALQFDELLLHYQPKICVATRSVCGVEALLRWHHPEKGDIPPDKLIKIAEQSDLINPITYWVMEQALRQTVAWQGYGIDLAVSVNLSVLNLNDAQFPQRVGDLLNKWKVPPEKLSLEITESAIMADIGQVMDNLMSLNEMGVTISIDDFGTGYSSLVHLKHVPVSEIKIEKSFVMHMDENDSDAVIVRAIIDLAHNLGLRVVAEGVESRNVWEVLEVLGCDLNQGYYVSRPMAADDLRHWLKQTDWKVKDILSR